MSTRAYAEAVQNFYKAVCTMNGKKGIKYRVQLTRGKTATMTPEERKQMNEFVNTQSDELRRTAGPPMDLKKIFHRGPAE